MCLKKYLYRGFTIHKNLSDDFHTPYYSTANDHIHTHVHGHSQKEIEKIIDEYWNIHNKKYYKCSKHNRLIKNKALRLLGYQIKYI